MHKVNIEIFIFNYNGRNTVLSTIESLLKNLTVDASICVIDDHSTDDSLTLIKDNYPEVTIHRLSYNTKKLNLLRNKALELARGKYLFITDNDLKFDCNCLSELLKVMDSDDKIATCTPRLMHWDQPNKIYAADTKVHFIGGTIADQRDKIYKENTDPPSTNSGGGIFLVRREAAIKVGGFDENFMIGWGDDGEFYQRLLRAGYLCLYVPSAFALHENKIVETLRKNRVVGQTYNRWRFILSHYSVPLIIFLIPVFFLYEVFQIPFVLIKGVIKQYVEGNLLVIKNFQSIIDKRKIVQELKVVSDKKVLYPGALFVAPSLIQNHAFIRLTINTFSYFLNLYWRVIKNIIP